MTTRRELLGVEGHWLLEVEASGRVLRFATAPLEVLTEAGDLLVYREGLGDFEQGQSSEGSTDFAVGVDVTSAEAWDLLVANFVTLERAPATIRRWHEGMVLEDARVMIEGFVSGFSYGEQDESVSFSVVRRLRSFSRTIPSPGMVVDATTWPVRGGFELDEKIVGVVYPVIFGTPGNSGGSINPATEALLVEWRNAPPNDRRLLIAGHRVAASEVTIYDYTDEDTPHSAVAPVVHSPDGVGRMCALADVDGLGFTIEKGRTYYVGWNGPGISRGVNPILGALDLIEWVLRTWTDQRLDAAQFSAVRDQLNAYRLDPYLMNAFVDPLEWLNAEVLPFLPVEPRQGVDGLYYKLRKITATPKDSVARLDADAHQVQRTSNVSTSSDDVVNEITIEYAPDRSTGRFRSRIVIGPNDRTRARDEFEADLEVNDPRIVGSYRAKLSEQLFGRQPITIPAPSIFDPVTASRVARDIIDAQALPRRSVSYEGGSELAHLSEGDVVTVNDTAVGLVDVLAEVRDVIEGGAVVSLDLLLFDDPVMLERL